ncbi:hypothetical protein JJE68_01154 [Pediococcus acidilactici]|nr:hypothetical protein JJE68_01154 [Pediococcus acidilactici]
MVKGDFGIILNFNQREASALTGNVQYKTH